MLAWSASSDGRAELFNRHYLSSVGLSADQARDWGWSTAVHPDDLNDLNTSDAMVAVHDRPRRPVIGTEREDGEQVRLTVRDAGIGVDRESVDKLFDPFYTTKSGGTGIGMAISRSIIESHHGRIWAAPNDGPARPLHSRSRSNRTTSATYNREVGGAGATRQ